MFIYMYLSNTYFVDMKPFKRSKINSKLLYTKNCISEICDLGMLFVSYKAGYYISRDSS
jgi:hypothetical protein